MQRAFSQSEQGIPTKYTNSSSTHKKEKVFSHQKTKSGSSFIPKLDLTKIKRDVDIESEYQGQNGSEDMVIVDEMKVQDFSEEFRQ